MPPAMQSVVEQCHALLGVKPVPILLSLEGRGPATLGICNPVLVVPDWFLSLCLLPISFHPAAALIKARIDQTRELACDEIAAESLSTRTQYARSLLSIAQTMGANQHSATAGYALGLFDTNTLEDRIMNVLATTNRIRKTWARASVLAASGLLMATCFGATAFSVHVAQPSHADLQQFVGTWQARFKGKIFSRAS